MWEEVERLLVGENVFFDTAFIAGVISGEQFQRIVKEHGADKILFATDNPWMSEEKMAAFITENIKDMQQLEKVLYKNALRLL